MSNNLKLYLKLLRQERMFVKRGQEDTHRYKRILNRMVELAKLLTDNELQIVVNEATRMKHDR